MKAEFNGKTILITGGSSGIGGALAVNLRKLGARVIATYRTASHMKKIHEIDPEIEFIRGDLSDSHDIHRITEKVFDKVAEINGFVHCAGEIFTEPFETFKTYELRRMLEVNVEAGFILLRDILPLFKQGGSVVFVSSIDALFGEDTPSSGYAVTKGAINSLTVSLAFELGTRNIRVNSVLPGLIRTPLTEDFFKNEFKGSYERFLKRIPLGREGKDYEVADLIIYLLSEKSSYITGDTIFIDGGYHTS